MIPLLLSSLIMPACEIIKNADFRLISEFAQPDAKKRLAPQPRTTFTAMLLASSFSIR